MWLCLYAYQLMPSFYVTAFVCRPVSVGRWLRDVISYRSLMSYDLALCSLVAWTILKGQRDPQPHFNGLTLFGATVFLCIACSLVVAEVSDRKSGGQEVARRLDVIMIRALVINGWSALATWCAILCLYDVANVVHVTTSLSLPIVRYSWLGGVAVLMIVLFVVDVFCTTTCFQFAVSPFIVALLAYVAVALNSSADDVISDVMKYITYALIAMMAGLMFAAIGSSMSRRRRRTHPEKPTAIRFLKLTKEDGYGKVEHVIYKDVTCPSKQQNQNV